MHSKRRGEIILRHAANSMCVWRVPEEGSRAEAAAGTPTPHPSFHQRPVGKSSVPNMRRDDTNSNSNEPIAERSSGYKCVLSVNLRLAHARLASHRHGSSVEAIKAAEAVVRAWFSLFAARRRKETTSTLFLFTIIQTEATEVN